MANLGMMTFSGISIDIGGCFIGIHLSLGLSAVSLALANIGLMSYIAFRQEGKLA